ncbi:MAG: PQQ-binding-like beta-propeller repeat protein [Alphaproteobacteria bacterium]|nr:PQQ-binding-like beta-propeller repeat protein [Alphaproteobacteria bacterium]
MLENQIIRSIAIHPSEPRRILVGLKGKAAGDAKVIESRDGGETWQPLNRGTPLDPRATDVQAVAYGPDETILAGTWKHGLYVSQDDGRSFAASGALPSTDIRDLKPAAGNPALLFAATARDGVFRSGDGGQSWTALGPGPDFFWSVTVVDDATVYAMSLEKTVYRSSDRRATWSQIFDQADAYALAVAPGDPASLALATKQGLYLSRDSGGSWTRVSEVPEVELSSVLWRGEVIYAGSWDGGVYAYNAASTGLQHLEPDLPVVHLRAIGGDLLAATWGKGLVRLSTPD